MFLIYTFYSVIGEVLVKERVINTVKEPRLFLH